MINKYISKLKTDIKPFRAAIFTVIISITATFSVSVVSSIGKQIIANEMDAIGMNGLSACAYNTEGENTTNISFFNDISAMQETNKASPLVFDNAIAAFENGIVLDAMVWGIDAQAADIISLNIATGRMLNSGDIQSNALVCLIDNNLAETVYKRSNITGKQINISIGDRTAVFKIIGTVEKGSNVLNALTGDVIPDFIYIPHTTLTNISSKNGYDQIVFTSSDKSQTVSEFKQKLVDRNHKYRNQIIKLTNLSGQKEQIGNIADTAFMALFLVSCVAVIVCSITVGSSVNTAVISKQKDIGIKISMGASRRDIAKEFLLSALIACIIGIAVSILLITNALFAIKYIVKFNFTVDSSLIVLSIFAIIILTIIFSIAPSYSAAKMSPVKALNRE